MGKQSKLKAQRRLQVLNMRSCGDCTACCTVMGVQELGKAPGTSCVHLNQTGCTIYSKRPRSCQEYNCVWRQGHGLEEHRPDRFGVILSTTNKPLPVVHEQGLIAHEVVPGAFDTTAVLSYLERIAQNVVVIGVRGTKRRFIGAPEKVKALLEHADKLLQDQVKCD